MGTPTVAKILFVGIVSFSTQFDPALKEWQAVMPRISGRTPSLVERLFRTDNDTTPVSVADPDIEPHTAFIAFEACDYISSKGWSPRGLETRAGYLYVVLDGDHVTFNGATQREEAPQLLDLPHMQPCCDRAALRREFQPPHYRGAAAVFRLGGGTLNAC